MPILLVLLLIGAAAEGQTPVKPYEGSKSYLHKVVDSGEFLIPVGKEPRNRAVGGRSKKVMGKVELLGYRNPAAEPALIFGFYRASLEEKGFEVLYSCALAECGKSSWFEHLGPIDQGHYLAARLKRGQGDLYVALLVHKGGQTRIAVVEADKDAGKPAVSAEAMLADLQASGRTTLQGVSFVEGKAELAPGADPVLAEVAKLLQESPELSLLVVGHCDGVGDYEVNLELTKARAEAVAKALAALGIAPARLRAAGAGMMAPVTSNDSEQGRARNRRIELVRR